MCKWLCGLFKEETAEVFGRGFEAGLRAGRGERSAEIAKRLLAKGWDVPEVAAIALLEMEEVDLIRGKMELSEEP